MNNVTLWQSNQAPNLIETSDVPTIVSAAKQLREREKNQIAINLEAGNFDIATTFIWHKSMSLLKKQIEGLGIQFVSELLQRFDLDEHSDLKSSISDSEALSLASDLGIVSPTQAMRLAQSQQIVNHFSGSLDEEVDDYGMTKEEAISCLRVCVQGILGHDNISVAQDFAEFRRKLEQETFTAQSPEIIKLQDSPYFFVRTAISILLNAIKTGKGAQLEHASRNTQFMIPLFWDILKSPERWQVGQAYASEFAEGRKESVKALQTALLKVKGFDYVPENLRSNTFSKVANNVIMAHQAMNNFYNEPAPMKELASLGSSIPNPAFPICMTATLCVKLGNMYGVSNAAQNYADIVLSNVSLERWIYYLDGRLDNDRIILEKFHHGECVARWIQLIKGIGIEAAAIKSPKVAALITASIAGNSIKVTQIGTALFRASYS